MTRVYWVFVTGRNNGVVLRPAKVRTNPPY